MHYELWHVPSGNLVATSSREADLLALVQQTFAQQGMCRAEEFALGTEDSRGESELVLMGTDLVARALDQSRPSSTGAS
jgi:type II secretory pathway component PulL